MTVLRRSLMAGAAAVIIGGCTDFSTTPVSLGRVTVAVTDQDNVGVGQLVVDLLLTNGTTLWRSIRTNTGGTGEFGTADGGVIAQPYIVRLTPSGTYVLAPGETNNKPITVVIGQTTHVTFKVTRQQIGPPGS